MEQHSLPGARFVDPKVLARIGNLELLAKTVVDGFINGLHRSPYFGASVDFAEHRGYMPGDDIRRVDWKLYARTDRYYLKEYEADTNANFSVILDISRSMDFSSRGISKLEYGKYLCACLAYFAQKQRDRIGCVTFDNDIVTHIPPSAKHLDRVLHTLDRAKSERKGDLKVPMQKMAEHFGRRGILVIVSDWYESPEVIMEAVKPLRFRGNDLIVFHVLDPSEIDFNFTEAASFQDLETGEQIPVVPTALAAQYQSLVQEHIAALTLAVLAEPRRLHARQHRDAARLRAVQVPVRAPAPEPGEIDGVPRTSFLRRARHARHSDSDPSDAARAEAGRRVSVADVSREDSVSVRAAPPHSRLAAARDAAGGDSPDRARVRAAVFRSADRRRWRARRGRAKSSSCSIARTAWDTAIAGRARRRPRVRRCRG